jgi:transcriptional repressor NrdR
LVVKKDGTRELFTREKLAKGIFRAFEKRPVSVDKIEKIIGEIERRVYEQNKSEISSKEIGEVVMDRLLSVDDVAYVRFASVYRSFTDIESFEKVLSSLKKSRLKKV